MERFIENYQRRKINREQMSSKLRVSIKYINNWLYVRKIDIWDKKTVKKPENKVITKYMDLYQKQKITRKQIVKKLSVSIQNVNNWIYKRKLKVWDSIFKYTKVSYSSGKEEIIRIKRPGKEWKFTPLTKKELKKLMTNFENYERMIYEYNK